MDDLLKNIQSATAEILTDEVEVEPAEEPVLAQPVDVYQEQRNIEHDYAKRQFPRGSRAQVLATVQDVVNGAGTSSLSCAYKKAKDDAEALEGMGDYMRAQIIKNQYMQGHFLPAVEVVVNFTSPDEVLNSKEALRVLDKYALGVGEMTGYTAAYIREAYGNQLGNMESASSPMVSRGVARLNGLLDTDQMQTAYALAKKLKKMIDEGKTIASEGDYGFISTIASRAKK